MLKLFISNLKMLVRNKQALFWSMVFPIIFTVIFGFFFSGGSSGSGTIVLKNNSQTEISKSIQESLKESDVFKIDQKASTLEALDLLNKGKISGIIEIPENFGALSSASPKKIKVIVDPANLQSNAVLLGFLNQLITSLNFKVNNIQPVFGIEQEKTNSSDLNFFDFILIGLIGMALMNSSIQGVSIAMSHYRENKILKRITTTPLKPATFIIAEVLSRLIINIIQISIILLIGVYGFHAHIYGNIFLIYMFGILGAILFQSIGFTIAAVSKTTSAAEGMATAVAIPMMFLAGVFFPIDQLPSWLESIVKYLPLAPLLRMMRGIALESVSPFLDPINIVIVLAWIVVMLVISSYKFRLSDE